MFGKQYSDSLVPEYNTIGEKWNLLLVKLGCQSKHFKDYPELGIFFNAMTTDTHLRKITYVLPSTKNIKSQTPWQVGFDLLVVLCNFQSFSAFFNVSGIPTLMSSFLDLCRNSVDSMQHAYKQWRKERKNPGNVFPQRHHNAKTQTWLCSFPNFVSVSNGNCEIQPVGVSHLDILCQ